MNKLMLKAPLLSIATTLVLGIVGCSSGGGSSDGGVTSTTQSGTGIDGILVNSTVCIDVNQNSACDSGEDSTLTDQNGKFTLTSTQSGPLLLVGGNDIGTGLPFTGSLKAPAGSTVITPLTSAVQALVDAGESAADAEASVKSALGLPDIDLTNFDPLDLIENGTAQEKLDAQALLAEQAHLQTIVHAVAATIAGADADTDIADVMANVFEQVVGNLDNLSPENVAAATKAVATEVYSAPDKLAAQVAVRSTAENAAASAVLIADATKDDIVAATPADATQSFNTAVTLANTSLEAEVDANVAAAQVAADALAPVDLAAIAAAQVAADAAAAEIAAAQAAAVVAAQAAIDAEAAYQAAADKETYDAYLEALAQEARQAAAARAAADAAAVAAAEAAAQEAQIAADAAAAQAIADAELLAAQAAAVAQAAADALAVAAAEQAAADALAAADLAAAQAAALAAEEAAALAIAQANVQIEANKATAFAVQAEADNDAVTVIAGNYTLDANITNSAGDAAVAARAAADLAEAAVTAAAADTNATEAQAEVAAAVAQVAIASAEADNASAALTAARAVVIAADIAEAGRVATIQASILEIAGYVSDANASAVSAEANATLAEADRDAALALATDDNSSVVQAVVDSAALARTAATNAGAAATSANITVNASGTAAQAEADVVSSATFAATAATEAATAAAQRVATASNLTAAISNETTVLALIAGFQSDAATAATVAATNATAAESSAALALTSATSARTIANTNGDASASADSAEAASTLAATAAGLSRAASNDAATAKAAADAATNEVVAEAQADAAAAAAIVANTQAIEAAAQAALAETAYQAALTIENARIAAAIATSQAEAEASLVTATTKAGEADASATSAETLATNAEAAAALDSAAAPEAANARAAATAARTASDTAATALAAATTAKVAADAATTEAAAATAAADAATAATNATAAAATAATQAANAQTAYDAAADIAALAVAQTEATAAATAAAAAATQAEADATQAEADRDAAIAATINTTTDASVTTATTAATNARTAATNARAASDSATAQKDAAIATSDIPTAESAATAASGFKDTAVAEAATASTQAGIANTARVAVDTEVTRVTTAIAGFRTTAQTAAITATDANTTAAGYATQARTAANAAQVIADSNSNAQTAADAADAAADAAEAAANAAATAAAEAATANATAIAATTEVDAQTAANAAATAATAAVDAATAAGVQAANAAAALENAQNTTPPVVSDSTWYDGKTLHSFRIDDDNGEIFAKYEDIELSAGNIVFAEYKYDKDSETWLLESSDNDIVLNTTSGAWEEETSETYEINASDNAVMRINAKEDIRIDSVADLSGLTVNFESEDGSVVIPVTFSAGALKYNTSWRVVSPSYRLEWEPTAWDQNGDTGIAYTSLEDYMNSNGNFYWDESTNTGVEAEKNVDGNLSIDSNGDPIGTLTLGDTGNLVQRENNGTITGVVGTWSVVNLPNQSDLTVQAVLDTNAPNYDTYMQYGQTSATMYDATDDSTDNATVHMIEYETAGDFVVEDEDVLGNAQAMDDIKEAVEAYYANGLAPLLAGQTLWTTIYDENNTLESWSFSPDMTSATWVEVVGGSCSGGEAIEMITDGFVATPTSDSCGPLDSAVTITFDNIDTAQSDGYLNMFIDGSTDPQRLYFSESDARDYFINTTTPSIVGSWVFDESVNERNVLTFLDSNNYIIFHEHTDTTGGTQTAGSAEQGTYTWDGTNVTFSVVNETDGDGGFTDMSTAEMILSADGNSLEFDSNSFAFSRVTDASNSMVGSWILTDGTELNVLTILSDTEYSIVHGANNSYITEILLGEFGTFSDDGTYTTFIQSVNTDSDGGLSDIGTNIEIAEDPGVSLAFVSSTESFTFLRLGDTVIPFSADLGSITESEFTSITHDADPTGKTWWYVEDANNYESITISAIGAASVSDGTVSFLETVDGSIADSGTLYYTIHNEAIYGNVVGIQESDGNTTYVEYVKFYNAMDQAALETAFPNITWSTGAAAVTNAGISNGESFDPWIDAGTFATVNYADFSTLITGMTFGNSSIDDDAFLIGNGLDAIVFPSGTASSATSGDVVLSSDNSAVVGSFVIRDVDGVSTLVVTITDSSFDDDHIAFQHDGTDMYRGEIYDRWSDLLLNSTAKDDFLNSL